MVASLKIILLGAPGAGMCTFYRLPNHAAHETSQFYSLCSVCNASLVGKGTFASIMSKEYNIPAISTGDLVRNEIKEKTPLGVQISRDVAKGNYVSDNIMIDMVKRRISQDDCKNGFILDGFPRTLPQAEMLSKIIPIDTALLLNLDENVLVTTICGRRSCPTCPRTYNLASINTEKVKMTPLAPKKENTCDECNSTLIRRDDDYENVVRNRLQQYHKQTEPVIEYYRGINKLNEFEVYSGKKDWPRLHDFLQEILPHSFQQHSKV